MSLLQFAKTELACAIARGVSQYVMVGSEPWLRSAVESALGTGARVFAIYKDPMNSEAGSALTPCASEPLAAELEKSGFDRGKASLFVWFGSAGYRAIDAVIGSLAFIASLPKGSGVVLDYMTERTSFGARTHTALDALASCLSIAGNGVEYLIQPQAVAALLRGVGFQQVADLVQDEPQVAGGHLVSAVV
jgi:hypothetical protein